MKQDASLKRCPRCGSKQLHRESSLNRGVSVVICQDCDAVFESYRERGKHRPRVRHEDDSISDEHRWREYVEADDEAFDEDEDEADETDFGDDDHMEDDDPGDEDSER